MTTTRRLALPLLATAALGLPLAAAGAATVVKPTTGRYGGEHGFDGPITLTFERESGIGLYLDRFSFTGTLKCDDGETVPFRAANRRVTARTAARVTKGRFTYRAADIIITGRWSRARTVSGQVTLRSTPCTKTTGFAARRR